MAKRGHTARDNKAASSPCCEILATRTSNKCLDIRSDHFHDARFARHQKHSIFGATSKQQKRSMLLDCPTRGNNNTGERSRSYLRRDMVHQSQAISVELRGDRSRRGAHDVRRGIDKREGSGQRRRMRFRISVQVFTVEYTAALTVALGKERLFHR